MRVLVDITETSLRGMNTGIQRVVRNVVSRSGHLRRSLGVDLVPVIASGGTFHAVTDIAAALAVQPRPSAAAPSLGGRPAQQGTGLAAAKRLLRRLPWLYRASQRVWYRHQERRHLRALSARRPIVYEQDDVVLLLDSFWAPNGVLAAVGHCRRGAVPVVPVVYDLIPRSHPQFCDDRIVREFNLAVPQVLQQSAGVLAISATVAAALREYMATFREPAAPGCRVDHFHLGSDFAPAAAGRAAVAAPGTWPPGLWGAQPVFLMLGTLEPRKGHACVLDAFEQRWARGARESLLFLGTCGWKMEEFMQRLQASPHLGTSLFVVQGAGDDAVGEAIRQSHAGIVASAVEGFGLPIVEFMQMGLPVLASDIAVFREVGGDFPLYFAPGDPDSLVSAIDAFHEREAAIRSRLAAFHWVNWNEAAEALVGKAMALVREAHRPRL